MKHDACAECCLDSHAATARQAQSQLYATAPRAQTQDAAAGSTTLCGLMHSTQAHLPNADRYKRASGDHMKVNKLWLL